MEVRLNELPCGFISLNHEANITEANQTFLTWFDMTEQQVIGQHIETLLTIASKMMFHSYFYPMINLNGQVEELFIYFKNSEGKSLAYLMNAKSYVRNNQERIDCILMPVKKRIDYEIELRTAKRQLEQAYQEKEQALAKLQSLHEEIEQKQRQLMKINDELLLLSNTDKLTGIANRRLFQNTLEELIQRFQKHQKGFSLLLLDIDFFKKVNDTFGHAVGDIVLQKLAALLSDFARSQDRVARYGGEEFVLLAPDVGEEEALQMAQRLNKAVEQYEWSETGGLTVSVGVATFAEGETADSILEHADQALYYSKQTGRNRATHCMQMNKAGLSK